MRSAAGVPSDVPPTMLDVPDDGPGDGFGDRQCSRTPAGAGCPGCQAIRQQGYQDATSCPATKLDQTLPGPVSCVDGSSTRNLAKIFGTAALKASAASLNGGCLELPGPVSRKIRFQRPKCKVEKPCKEHSHGCTAQHSRPRTHAKRCCPGRDDAPAGVPGDVPDGVGLDARFPTSGGVPG